LYNIARTLGLIDQTHFSDGYIGKFYKEYMNERNREAHNIINEMGKRESFDCYNATLGGDLEVYERVELNDILYK
jgi:hypothetical protein